MEYTPENMIRLWPHHSPGEGHFVALMQCTGKQSNPVEHRPRYKRTTPGIPRPVQAVFDAWCRENLIGELPEAPTLVGSRLYAIPEGLPDISPLRVVHPGWWLGMPKKDRFEPAHALAMGLRVNDIQHTLSLPVDSPDVLQYLRCEMLHSSGENGWVVVAVKPQLLTSSLPLGIQGLTPPSPDPFPLGWGKRVQGIVKNHYPRGLQWL
jgi:NOL1/NOP2/fmu family ribosome biogenesis protein